MKNSISVKALGVTVGLVLTLIGAGWQASRVLATKTELAQTDAKADYALQALLERTIAKVTLLENKVNLTAGELQLLAFYRTEVRRIQSLISGGA